MGGVRNFHPTAGFRLYSWRPNAKTKIGVFSVVVILSFERNFNMYLTIYAACNFFNDIQYFFFSIKTNIFAYKFKKI